MGTLPQSIVDSPPWWPTVAGMLGPDAELRSATVILSSAQAFVTNEAATPQAWHSVSQTRLTRLTLWQHPPSLVTNACAHHRMGRCCQRLRRV